ncbi:hypothetical protein [Epibacterium ulvae]|uniref:hypothetical protein n=1 Tax=Epibacterium ulvae TaxID=1156985 RepID=UPI002491610E|nr:hypothetical protein [Epibacterium ulvae]
MKTLIAAIVATSAAAPVLAHTDNHFHTHGIELLLILAAIAAGAALFMLKR